MDKTELVFILDESGSMSGLEKDTIGGFNSLIEKQKKEKGEAVVTTVIFSDNMKFLHDRVEIKDVETMTDKDYTPSGCTALLDTIGNTINHIIKKQSELKEEYVPNKTMVVITTDGLENASREFNYQKVKTLIEKQKELGWEFIFLGANIDVYQEAHKFGINPDMAVEYCCDVQGVAVIFDAINKAVKNYRKAGKVGQDWRKDIDEDLAKRKPKK